MAATQYSDPFVQKAMSRMEEIQARRRELLRQATAIQDEMRTLDAEGNRLMALLEGYTQFMGMNGAQPPHEARRSHHDMPRGLYGQLAFDALVALGGRATLGAIVGHLRGTEQIPAEPHSYYSTRSALNRHEGIFKSDGLYQLKELPVRTNEDGGGEAPDMGEVIAR